MTLNNILNEVNIEFGNATTPVAQKTFIQKFKEKIQASAITEEIKENYIKTFREYLINEEITGDMAIVYHRGDRKKLDHLLKQTYINSAHIDFNSYHNALYTTTSMASQLNQVGNLNNMKSAYGKFIIKLAFKGVSNCWFCSFDEYEKYNRCTIDNWKEQQLKKFNIDKEHWEHLIGSNKKFTADHVKVSKFFEHHKLLGKRVKGIQYFGNHDGDCLLIYDWTTAVPLAVSNNEGKTWKKVDKNKTAFQRGNFKNNDYIDTNKVITPTFETDGLDVECYKKQLTTLKGAPKEIGRKGFSCNNNQLTTLEGAPQEVFRGFECNNNQLTTLKGAPQKVGGGFSCNNNQLTTLEGAPKEVGGTFSCNNNQLITLKGAPQVVRNSFICSSNKLTTLEGASQVVKNSFDCHNNQLTTLKGAPQIIYGNFICSSNKLTTLEGAPQTVFENFECNDNKLTTLKGAPKAIGGTFNCRKNQLTTLEGAPQKVKNFDCSSNKLTTLEGAPKEVGGTFDCHENNLPKEKIINYLEIAKIGRGIYTDYGNFENQKEALKKLTENKKVNYFPY